MAFAFGDELGGEVFGGFLVGVVEGGDGSAADVADFPDDFEAGLVLGTATGGFGGTESGRAFSAFLGLGGQEATGFGGLGFVSEFSKGASGALSAGGHGGRYSCEEKLVRRGDGRGQSGRFFNYNVV